VADFGGGELKKIVAKGGIWGLRFLKKTGKGKGGAYLRGNTRR